MDYLESKSHISESLKLLKIHKRRYLGGVNEGILLDHFMSLKCGLKFLGTLIEVSKSNDLIQHIRYPVANVKQELYLLRYLKKDGSLIMKLEHAYADLREEMKSVVIKPETNKHDLIFPEIFTRGYVFSETSVSLCEKIKELATLYFKGDQITPMMKELEDVRNMLISSLESFFIYVKGVGMQLIEMEDVTSVIERDTCFSYLPFIGKLVISLLDRYAESSGSPLTVKEKEENIFVTMDRAIWFIYLSFVGKMDAKLILSLKNSLSDLVIEETQILKMNLILDLDSIESLKSHIYMSLRLLDWNKKCYSGTEMGAVLEDHFMSIKHGLQFLDILLELSIDIDLKLRIQHLVSIVKQKLYSLLNNQDDENLIVKLEHAYGELREAMHDIVVKPGTNDYYTIFPKNLKKGYHFIKSKDFLLEKIRKLVTSSYKADQIAPMMKELKELRNKLTSLKFNYEILEFVNYGEKMLAALTTLLDRATCLIYLSFVGKLNEDMLVSLKKNLSLLIEETEIKKMSLVLGIINEDDLEADIDISISLLKRRGEYNIGTINESILKDHIMSLRNGLDFLKWLPEVHKDRDLKQRIIVLAGNVKQKLESLTYKQGGERLNMDVNGAYAYNDFLLDKITTLVTLNCKADQISPVKKELQDLWKILKLLKPLLADEDNNFTFFTVHLKATFIIYLCLIGEMDVDLVLFVKSNIASIKESDVFELYTMILNKVYLNRVYLEEELCLLENLIFLFKSKTDSLNDASSTLFEVLTDIHSFLLGIYPKVLLRKRHLLQASFQAIIGHSIHIVCSCYLQDTVIDISTELNCVLDLIKHIKSEAQEIKLYYFPKTDGLGFLTFFSLYLEDLIDQEISVKEEIDALHFEVHSLLSLSRIRDQDDIDETPWTDITNMAYQAEYIIDLYLVSSSRDLRVIPYLSKITEQLKNIREHLHGLGGESLPAQDVAVTFEPQVLGMTTQVSDNDAIVVLPEEAKLITEYLLEGERELDVISLVGMAGVGKTTLALTLFKSTHSIARHFDILAWCTVSQRYQKRNLLLSILEQIKAFDKNHRSISDDQELAVYNHKKKPDDEDLAVSLCRRLKQRRYLIVLDDMWDTTLWNDLKYYLPDDKKGSRILITSRNQDVAHQIGSKVNQLHPLSEKRSWELFQKKIIEKESLSNDLLEISKGIVEDCRGLPLSIVIIAGILADIERTEEKWNEIAESVSSIILSDPKGKCKAILELSYNHLPNHLRSCFLYLGSFAEDREILVDHVIMLWIAEGLVRDTNSAEGVANKYIKDLIDKSLLIPAKERSQGGLETFRIHDILRDFCLDKATEQHFFTVVDETTDSLPLQDPRRVIIKAIDTNGLRFSYHSIRTMICFDELDASEIEKRILFCDMMLLKVLELHEVHSNPFTSISSLVHLRYLALGLWNTDIPVLPSSVSKLHNLQILILICSEEGIVVPDLLWDMVKLRYVNITPRASFQVNSNRLQNSSFLLKNLKFLSQASVSSGDSKWLSKLSGLQRLKCIFVDNLERDEDNDDPKDNQFRMLSFNAHLTSLRVKNAIGQKQRFISTCQLPISLRELTLSKFFLTSTDISEIGRSLPHLEVFRIYNCYVPSDFEWNVDDEDFPELKFLKLRDLKICKWVASEDSFPSLEQLWVEKCDRLDEIPLDFGSLPQLRRVFVNNCAPSVDDSAREIEKLQHEEQNTEMRACIYPRINRTHYFDRKLCCL